jgi:hypothetical protein
MPNPFFSNLISLINGNKVRGPEIEAKFTAVETGCDGVNTALSLKASSSGQTWTGAHDFTAANITVPTPTLISQAVNKAYADSLVAALPNGTLPSVAGKDTSWYFSPNTAGNAVQLTKLQVQGQGGQNVTGNVTLTATSAANIAINSATLVGSYVTLPAANTCQAGATLFTFTNNTKFDYGVRGGDGTKLGWIRAGQMAMIGLSDNSTIAGVWSTFNVEKVGVTAETNLTRAYTRSLQLDATRILFWVFTAPNIYGVIYDYSTGLFGAETLLATNAFMTACGIIKNATNQVAIVYSTVTTTDYALIVTCTGTSLLPNASVNIANGLASIGTLSSQSGINLAVGLVGTSLVYSIVDGTNNVYYHRVITISGTVPTFSVTPQSTNAVASGCQVEIFSSGSVVRIINKATSFQVYCSPYTVSGSTLTPGTSALPGFGSSNATNIYLNGNGNIIAAHSPDGYAAYKLTGTVEAVNFLSLATRDRIFQLTGNTFISWVAATGVTSLITDTAGVLSTTTAATLVPITISGLAATMSPVSNVGNVVKFVGSIQNQIRVTYINYGVSPPVITSDVTYVQNVTNGANIIGVPIPAGTGISVPNLLTSGSTECALYGNNGSINSVLATSPVPKVLTTGHLAAQFTLYGFTKNEAWGSSANSLQRAELAA